MNDPSARSGEAKASKAPPAGGRRLVVRFEGVELETPGDAEGIAADWNPDTGTAEEFLLDASKKRVQLPRGQAARRASIAWSPDRKKVAFATQADACADKPADRAAALYLVDVESGKLKHVSKGQTGFSARFLDPTTLAYADEEGGVRLYDAVAGRENGRLTTKGGLGLIGGFLDESSKKPFCHKAWRCAGCFNRKHMLWAWCSLFSVGFSDLYVRLCSMGVLTDWRLF